VSIELVVAAITIAGFVVAVFAVIYARRQSHLARDQLREGKQAPRLAHYRQMRHEIDAACSALHVMYDSRFVTRRKLQQVIDDRDARETVAPLRDKALAAESAYAAALKTLRIDAFHEYCPPYVLDKFSEVEREFVVRWAEQEKSEDSDSLLRARSRTALWEMDNVLSSLLASIRGLTPVRW